MGYADFGNFKVAPFDGYSMTTVSTVPVYSNWIDLHSSPYFDMTAVFTGGSPAGTLQLQKSNNLQWTGGNRPQPLQQGGVGAVDDTINVPTGNGNASATVTGAGVYELDQHFAGYRWVRLVFTPSSAVTTQLDVFFSWKK